MSGYNRGELVHFNYYDWNETFKKHELVYPRVSIKHSCVYELVFTIILDVASLHNRIKQHVYKRQNITKKILSFDYYL